MALPGCKVHIEAVTRSSPRPPPSVLPLHHRAYLLLLQRIQALSPEARLPGEHELAEELGVARMTLRRALARLEAEGRIIRRRGDGTRRLPEPARPGAASAGPDVVAQLLAIGAKTETRLLRFETVHADASIAQALGIEPGAPVRQAELIRCLGSLPVSHLSACFADTAETRGLSTAQLTSEPLLVVTERLFGPVREVRQVVTAVLAFPALSDLLGVEAGAPLMRVTRRFIGDRGTQQASVAHYRADCFDIEMREVRSATTARDSAYCEVRMRLDEGE